MIQVKVFNQRDPQWKDEKHGTSNSTIGQTGCTICVICSVLWHAGYKDINPSKLNKALTDNKGYSQGNLVIWSKVAELYPKLRFNTRLYSYDNNIAATWIKHNGIIPIVRVSAAPIGGAPGGKHWVGFVGDHKSIDPWNGNIVDTSTWEPDGMAIYDYTPTDDNYSEEGDTNMPNMYKGYDLSNAESMKVAVDKLVEVMEGVYIKKDEAERLLNEAVDKVKEDLTKANQAADKLKIEAISVRKILKLADDASNDDVLGAINTLMQQPEHSDEQSSTPEGELPKTYNGKEVIAVIIKP